MDPHELTALGVYDPDAPDAAERLTLVQLALEHGAPIDDIRGAIRDSRLHALAAERLMLDRPSHLTLADAATKADVTPEFATRLWRALGFALAEPDSTVCTDGDVDVLAFYRDVALSVGPESAGAEPGPAAYGFGGEEATVTDAHVVLRHLPTRLLGGRMALDVEAARRAIDRKVAAPLGLSREQAARGVLAIIDNHMVGALRIVSIERGHDPRDFTLVPFGGAGPLHGCALAELLGITRVMIPLAPGVLCADGLLAADLDQQPASAHTEAERKPGERLGQPRRACRQQPHTR